MITIYRMYHCMYSIKKEDYLPVREEWFSMYESKGINMRSSQFSTHFWFDIAVLEMFEKYGTTFFRKECVWDINWKKIAVYYNRKSTTEFSDPRTTFERIVHLWLKKSQYHSGNRVVKKIDAIIRYLNNKL